MLCVCVYVCWLLHSLEKNIMLSVWVTATYMGPFIWYGRYASWRIQLIGEAETSWPHIHASLICSFPVSTSSKTIQPCRSFENMLCIGFGFFMWNEEAKSRSRACVTKKKMSGIICRWEIIVMRIMCRQVKTMGENLACQVTFHRDLNRSGEK